MSYLVRETRHQPLAACCRPCRTSLGLSPEQESELLEFVRKTEKARKFAVVASVVTIGASLLALFGISDLVAALTGRRRPPPVIT